MAEGRRDAGEFADRVVSRRADQAEMTGQSGVGRSAVAAAAEIVAGRIVATEIVAGIVALVVNVGTDVLVLIGSLGEAGISAVAADISPIVAIVVVHDGFPAAP